MASAGSVSIGLEVLGASLFRDALRKASAAVSELGKTAISSASAFNETTNVMQQAFGKNASAMEAWAEATAAGIGRSTQAMRESASVFQSMLEPMTGSADSARVMSKSFTQLAVDLGSFWNVADNDALVALRAGISGETEPLKKFGVVMTEASLNAYALKQGLNATTQEMTEAEKTQLRYNFILENTKKAHGDAARTADGYANTMKALEADLANQTMMLGQQALPAWQDLVVTFRNLLSVLGGGDWSSLFTAIGSGIKTAGDMFLGAAEAALTFAGAIDQFLGGANEQKLVAYTNKVQKLRDVLSGADPGAAASGAPAASSISMLQYGQGFGTAGKRARAAQKTADDEAKRADAVRKESSLAWIRALEDGYRKTQKNIEADGARRAKMTTDWIDLAKSGSIQEMMSGGMRLAEPYVADALAGFASDLAKKFKVLAGADKLLGSLGFNAKDLFGGFAPQIAEALKSVAGNLGGLAGGIFDRVADVAKTAANAVMELLRGVMAFAKTAFDETIGGVVRAATRGNGFFGAGSKGGGVAMGMMGTMGASIAPMLNPMFAPLAPVLAPGLAMGGSIAGGVGLSAALLDLSTQTKSYAQWQKALTNSTKPLVDAMEPLWRQLLPLTNIFTQVNTALGQFLGVLIPGQMIARGLFDGVKFAAVGMLTVALEIGRIANKLGGDVDTRAIAGGLHNLEGITYDTAVAMDALGEAARSAMNVPEVAKVSYARYRALRDETGAMGADAAGSNRAADENAGGVIIYGDVMVMTDDIAAIQEKVRRGEYKRTGAITAGRVNRFNG